jgi:ribose 1,5-bisphosphokinase
MGTKQRPNRRRTRHQAPLPGRAAQLHAGRGIPQELPLGDERIGPGRLVLVVGPSGAGKDTLIGHARERCRADAGIVFPRRIVTRSASAAEDHATVSPARFDEMAAAGGFALWWRVHGLSYALPRAIDDDIGAGRTIVCNVSRTIIASARARYARVAVVLVTAPPEVLAARLAQRSRESADSIAGRLRRSEAVDDVVADFVIDNVGAPEVAADRLVEIIRAVSDLR